jgi:ech hydrogenase subunit B
MDLLLILFMLAFAVCAIILGAMGVNSPYSKLGAQRELVALLTYEPILIAIVIGIFFVTGSFKVADVLQHPKMLILDLPLLFIAFTYVLTVKLKKSPFDFSTSHHAHQELVKGLTTEFSGPTLAIIELTHWYETVFLLMFIGLFFANNIPLAILVALLCYFAEIVVDNIAARMTWQIMLRWGWTYGIFLCIVNLAWVYLKYSS